MVISYEKYKKIHEELALCRAELSSAKEELSESKLLLTEAESTLEAIRMGSVDALVVGDQVYTLKGVDYFYRVLLETMGAGAVVFIAEGTITYCNKSIADLLGTSVEKLIGSSIYDYVRDIYTEKFEALVQKGYSGTARGEVSMSFPLHSRDIPVYLSISQIQVDSSAAICMIVTDLTEHKSSKEHIASERLTRAVLEQAGESIVVCNNTGEIVRANASVYQLCGCNILYQYFDHVFHIKVTSTEENVEFSIAQILAGKTIIGVEAVLERTDRQIRYLLLHASQLKGETSEALGCVVTMTDISEHKHAEESIRLRNAQLDAVLASIADGLIVYDAHGRAVRENEKIRELFGYSLIEYDRDIGCIKNRIINMKTITNDGIPLDPEKSAIIRALRGETVSGFIESVQRADGSRTWLSMSVAPIRKKDRNIDGAVANVADITLIKKLQLELENRTKELEATFSSIADGVVIYGMDERIILINEQANKILGNERQELKRTMAERGEKFLSIFNAEGRALKPEEYPIYKSLHQGLSITGIELQIRYKDNTFVSVNSSSAPIVTKDGRQIGAVTTFSDISKLKQVESELRANVQRYNTLFNARSNGISHCRIITDEKCNPIDFITLQINYAYEEIIGVRKEDVEGKSIKEVFPGIEKFSFDYIGNFGKIALQGGELFFEVYFEPTKQWLSIFVCQSTYGEFTTLFTDITERKNAEEALKVRNAELNATIFSIAEGIIIYNMEGKIINLNKKAEEILGYSEETREKPMFDRITKYLKVEKEDGQLYPYDEIPVIRALQKREIVTGAEVCLRYSETERLIIDFSAAPIFTKEGIQIGAVATLADITDRKKAEKDLRRSEARFKQLTQTLEQRVNERTAQINVTNEELETLAYSMSHDLYNPIRGISANNGFAMEKCKERHCSLDELRYIERSRDNITKMEYMLDTMQYLLALLRKTMGRDNINLSLAAKRIMEKLKKEDNIRKGDVVIQPDVFTFADKEYVTEVLNGLLSNAWKYTGDKDRYYIEFGKKQIDGTDVYYVKDNGIGFKQEYADKIFQPYYRLQGHSSVREGYGIGLTIVLAIVKKHQGTVWAESEEGKGATFYFTFGGQESAVDMSRKAA
ncbi:MAG: hypothetical protein DKM50_13630 [Candidatus Margulisiibacteriota bacterium]|nr:MAG: hypothetical protein A2X43_05365 [Candidatus Margulisbacteria bacterium GWD2_39_127]OGI03428.1 MAG: hypothetical protein A2X42_05110 [Candidatus Margulisbacteria bacterium GWF2_38_17]OGI05617.1 MAG: hypothetical protein A2X41_06010 [Candidatus Margulisbacteria bacterium GWE2_39_32]PZM77246.1 MAG: hypothetical protein DKM50_13630 [Candidatus Margulisiibacteriota bacterium]HAR64470.1 hypothetical protein [Candidatus Margulisiibacteriota bacterium]